MQQVLAAQRSSKGEHLILITPLDLAQRGCESLFGYADRRRGIAVVSTYRLGADGESRLAARLMNVIEHERGHLDGLKHCRGAGCIMSVARCVEDLDARGLERCAQCLRSKPAWRARTVAAAVCILAVAAAQGAASFVKVKSPPFSWRPDGVAAQVLYKKQPMLRLAGEPEARAAATALNALYAQITPPPIEAKAEGTHAVLMAGKVKLAALDGWSAGGGEPLAYAQAWAGKASWLMRAKGEEAEGCPSCHLRRLDEVLAAAEMRRRRRW